jgi:NADPH-dependent curcumin reductase CurA
MSNAYRRVVLASRPTDGSCRGIFGSRPNLARAPEAFIGLLRGKNFRKQIVNLA